MAGNVNIKNANGKTVTLQNPDTNNSDIVVDTSKLASTVSPAFTGTPTAPTQTAGDNSTKLATTAYVDGKMVRGVAVASTSGTSIDFTGIPSWVKRITVMFNGVSTNGTSIILIQLGDSEGIENTGYTCNASGFTTVLGTTSYTTGFGISDNNLANSAHSGSFNINNLTGNTFTFSGITDFFPSAGSAKTSISAGNKTLSATLDRVRITTVNGTDTFDDGQINILYEG